MFLALLSRNLTFAVIQLFLMLESESLKFIAYLPLKLEHEIDLNFLLGIEIYVKSSFNK